VETSELSNLLSPWCNPLSNYPGSWAAIWPYVCPEALQVASSDETQLAKDEAPVLSPEGHSAWRTTSDHISTQATDYQLHQLSSGLEGSGDSEANFSNSPLSSIEPEASQNDGGNNPSTRCPETRQQRDSIMLTKPKSSITSTSLSIRSLQRRLAGKVGSDAIDHINSVLRYSSSNSWRSSIKSYASSWRSRESSLRNSESLADGPSTGAELNLSSNEQRSWDELVDETQLAPSAQSRPIHREISLTSRPCCAAIGAIDSLDQESLCSICDFSGAHNQGRHCVEILNRGLESIVFPHFVGNTDRFGNTPLHFAAASVHISTAALKIVITRGVNINAKNTSGESFMHVLNVPALGDVAEYIDLLRFLQNHDFRFLDRDHHGRTVAHKFFEGAKLWEINMRHLEEIFLRLRVDFSAVDNLGYDFGLNDLVSSWKSAALVEENETMSHGKLSSLRARHCDPQYLMVDYRAMLQSQNQKVKSWVGMVGVRSLAKWVDINGDTPLTAVVKYWPENEDERPLLNMVRYLVDRGCDIHARDRQGCTALAIAAKRGLRPAVSSLLVLRASVNTRSYRGTSTLYYATTSLQHAKDSGNNRLYAMIISCISLITDWGAKMEPTVYDEFVTFEFRKKQECLSSFSSPDRQPIRVYKRAIGLSSNPII
jgi:ankyrin repeat protein